MWKLTLGYGSVKVAKVLARNNKQLWLLLVGAFIVGVQHNNVVFSRGFGGNDFFSKKDFQCTKY